MTHRAEHRELIARWLAASATAALELNGRTGVRAWLEDSRETEIVGRIAFDR